MLSMTGFGSGETTVGQTTVAVELRSVNHRFLDVALKLPTALGFAEIDIRNVLKERVARGRVSCGVTVERSAAAVGATLSSARVAEGIVLLKSIADVMEAGGLPRPQMGLRDVLAVPGLFEGGKDDDDREALREAVLAALGTAIEAMHAMKRVEGEETAADMRRRLTTIRARLAEVNVLVPQALAEAHARLTERLGNLLGDSLEPQRLAQEAAILVDKGNINEECERLATHLDQVAATLDEGGQVAKRLNFLLQEMHREVNTMGSKTQNMAITAAVIAMKEEVESMREQVMNLE